MRMPLWAWGLAAGVPIGVGGILWRGGLFEAVPEAPVEAGPAEVRLSDFPGERCADDAGSEMLARAARLVAREPAGAHGIRKEGAVRVIPLAALDVGAGHGLRFVYAEQEGAPYGLLVRGVERGSVADVLGLEVDDVVGEVDDRRIRSTVDVEARIGAFREKGLACVRLLREGQWRTRWLVLEERVAEERTP